MTAVSRALIAHARELDDLADRYTGKPCEVLRYAATRARQSAEDHTIVGRLWRVGMLAGEWLAGRVKIR